MRPWNWLRRTPKSTGEKKTVVTCFDVEALESRTVLSASPVLDTFITPTAHSAATQKVSAEMIAAEVVIMSGVNQTEMGAANISGIGINSSASMFDSLSRSNLGRSTFLYDTAITVSRIALLDGGASRIAPSLGGLSAWANLERQMIAGSTATIGQPSSPSAPTNVVSSIATGTDRLFAPITAELATSLPVIAVTLSDGSPIATVANNVALPSDENGEQVPSADQLAAYDESLASEIGGYVRMEANKAKGVSDNDLSLMFTPSRFRIVRQPDNLFHHQEDSSTEFVCALDAFFGQVNNENGELPYLISKDTSSELVDAHATEWSAEYLAIMAFFHVSRGSNAIKNRQKVEPTELKVTKNSPE